MVIVSMTSFPARLELVPLAYTHFMKTQTVKCDKYVLWLSRAEFQGEKNPEELGLTQLVTEGLEIHWCDEDSKINIRHNSLKLWPDAFNLIIDEDLYYPDTYTEEMLKAARKYPECIISYFSSYELFTGYRKIYLPRSRRPSIRNKFNGGLSCFPPHTYPQICFHYEKIRDIICPYHDETWVNLFSKFMGTKVYGLHKMKWSSIEHIPTNRNIIHLHDVHSSKGGKYPYDVVQYNQILFVFPQLMALYKELSYGLYRLKDSKEIKRMEREFKKLVVKEIQ